MKNSIPLKSSTDFDFMREAGRHLASLFERLHQIIAPEMTTQSIDVFIEGYLTSVGLVSRTKGYRGYRYASCISINDEVVHGVPSRRVIHEGDLVKVDVCASYHGYCADMARCFIVGQGIPLMDKMVEVAQRALDDGIAVIRPFCSIGDISAAIQKAIEAGGFSIVRDFAGHGIGASMHENPEILNYGLAGSGPVVQVGMAFALEPMLTAGKYDVYIDRDGWTVKTLDRTLAAHVEDTVIVTDHGIEVITRAKN